MTISEILYSVFLGPLELIFENIYFLVCDNLVGVPWVCIFALSLSVNLFLMPLYNRTDAIQEEAIKTEKRMKPMVSHLKKTFKGDERFMMLQICYRQNHYKPTDALKGIAPLMLEIPFFMAAYNFLSKLEMLRGASFGPVTDLSSPDALLAIGTITVNVLPILMTAVNLISCTIYAKDAPLRSKIQMYGMAALFLVLLYDSPSGLVFYWTLNNVFSLVKNIIVKSKNPIKTLCIGASVLGIPMLILGAAPILNTFKTRVLALLLALALQIPSVLCVMKRHIQFHAPRVAIQAPKKGAFALGCILLTLLMGVLVPSALIDSSASEFVSAQTLTRPEYYVFYSFLIYSGLFLVWGTVFYSLAKPVIRKIMSFSVWLLSGASLVNYMFFGKHYGRISAFLKFDIIPSATAGQVLWNLAVLSALCAILCAIWNHRNKMIHMVYVTCCVAVLVMSGSNLCSINEQANAAIDNLEESSENITINIPMSSAEKNVVVIMLDRAISSYFPFALNEIPELREQFYGFTYYPNTLSYGSNTKLGSAAVYGGYDYTPMEMNRRDDVALADKQNEALKVLPKLFDEKGYEVTVCDPAYAGYKIISDLHIYDDIPAVKAYHLMGAYTSATPEDLRVEEENLRKKFVGYSFFKTAPVLLHTVTYSSGTYNQKNMKNAQICESITVADGINKHFMDAYDALEKLPDITTIHDEAAGTFLMMSNDTSHEPNILQLPDYTPAQHVDNTACDFQTTMQLNGVTLKNETIRQQSFYHCNMAAYIQLGKWFQYLQDKGVYDNTRIILVADHGEYLSQREDMQSGSIDAMAFNPILLVKDFDSKQLTTDDSFMTNADVPYLALKDLIDSPVNPFTGMPIDQRQKEAKAQYITASNSWDVASSNRYRFLPSDWYMVPNDVFHVNRWELVEEKNLPESIK